MSEEPQQLKATSANIDDEQKAKLKVLFPEVVTEGGKIDFDRLRLALGESVDVGKERYGMNWPGKADCFKIIQQPSMATLVPARDESMNFDTTENLIIEGDNLETLKLLQKSYIGKVKMIYIDPPYNTGNDFIYPDDYGESLDTYLRYTGQVDAEGRKFSTNTEADGRFHSKWLNMMYPRLYLARNLLREDGAIFISIDETEQPILRALCNEIFGEDNFIADMVWAAGRKNDSKYVSVSHEYIVVYARNKEYLKEHGILWRQRKEGLDDIYATFHKLRKKFGSDHKAVEAGLKEWFSGLPDTHPAKAHRHYSNVDARGIYFPADISWPGGGGPKYEVLHPKTRKPVRVPSRGWMTSDPKKMQQWIAEDRVHFGETEEAVPCIKSYLVDHEKEAPYSIFYQDGRAATKRLRDLFDADVFENPKDELVLKKVIEFATDKDSLILDFFAGSGTAAHAVLELNKHDGGNRKFILVQLPEPCDVESVAFESGYKTIADICKERVRRVIKKLDNAEEKQLPFEPNKKHNQGFKVFKLQSSNFKAWNTEQPKDDTQLVKQLALHTDHLVEGRSQEDVLYELLLKSGFPLDTKVEKIVLADKNVFSVAEGAMLICLDIQLTADVINAMAAQKPERVICLDAGFAENDQLKTNAVQTMKAKGVIRFQTV